MVAVDEVVNYFVGDRADKKPEVIPFIEIILATQQNLSVQEVTKTTFDKVKHEFTKPAWEAFVYKVKTNFYHAPYQPSELPNLLSEENAGTYEGLLAGVLVAEGKPCRNRHDIYGWLDFEASKHFRDDSCSVREVTTVQEDEWSEFQDTFSDNKQSTGLIGDAKCACGRWTGQLRAEMDLADLIRIISRKGSK